MLQMAVEELAKASAAVALILMVQELGTLPIQLFGSDELKERFLPDCATGEKSPAFCLSEPDAGSDAGRMRTTAKQDGDDWVINGTKNWITNAGIADFYVVFAVTDRENRRARPSSSRRTPRASRSPSTSTSSGSTARPPASPSSRTCACPTRTSSARSAAACPSRSAPSSAPASAPRRRPSASPRARPTTPTTTPRSARSFGKPINELQGIQFKLADMQTKTAAARELLYKACAMADRNDPQLGMYSSMAKLFASDTAMEVTVEAVQVLGGYGYVNEYPVERMMRDAKITQIYEGTNEIQRVVIARHMR